MSDKGNNFDFTDKGSSATSFTMRSAFSYLSYQVRILNIQNQTNRKNFLIKVEHCMKSVRIWCFSGPLFPKFGLNTKIYSVSFRMQYKCGKIRTRKIPNTDIFRAVGLTICFKIHQYNHCVMPWSIVCFMKMSFVEPFR